MLFLRSRLPAGKLGQDVHVDGHGISRNHYHLHSFECVGHIIVKFMVLAFLDNDVRRVRFFIPADVWSWFFAGQKRCMENEGERE